MANLSYSDSSLNNYNLGEPPLGPDADKVKFRATSNTDATLNANSLSTGDGKDKIELKAKAKGSTNAIDNSIDADASLYITDSTSVV